MIKWGEVVQEGGGDGVWTYIHRYICIYIYIHIHTYIVLLMILRLFIKYCKPQCF